MTDYDHDYPTLDELLTEPVRYDEKVINEDMEHWDWSLIPDHMHAATKNWVKFGIPAGSFFMAMMEHDLYNAIGRADLDNQKAIVNWVKFMHNYLPSGCHSNKESVDYWYKRGGLCGRK